MSINKYIFELFFQFDPRYVLLLCYQGGLVVTHLIDEQESEFDPRQYFLTTTSLGSILTGVHSGPSY